MPLALAKALIEKPSITPEDAGCQALLAERLSAIGFSVEALPFGEVNNLWAVHGDSGPIVCFAGHTDVVPAGDETLWSSPPFSPTEREGMLYGRGTADMKSSLAAMVEACELFLKNTPSPKGRIAFLITSDEEGPALDGTQKALEALQARGIAIDYAIVGEPSSTKTLGDTLKHGRRGSLHLALTLTGKQGHVAYPHLAHNPIHDALPLLANIVGHPWDTADEDFPATSVQVVNVHSDGHAENIIPATLQAHLNWRFSAKLNANTIQEITQQYLEASPLKCDAQWRLSGAPFLTPADSPLKAALAQATQKVTGTAPTFSTGGGTSDGRFFAPHGSHVVECGPVNASIHQVDEHIKIADIEKLRDIYAHALTALLG